MSSASPDFPSVDWALSPIRQLVVDTNIGVLLLAFFSFLAMLIIVWFKGSIAG